MLVETLVSHKKKTDKMATIASIAIEIRIFFNLSKYIFMLELFLSCSFKCKKNSSHIWLMPFDFISKIYACKFCQGTKQIIVNIVANLPTSHNKVSALNIFSGLMLKFP